MDRQHNTGFFHLSVEIREKIYQLYFDFPNQVIHPCGPLKRQGVRHGAQKKKKTVRMNNFGTWALLQTCQTIYHEALGVLYEQHQFVFTDQSHDTGRLCLELSGRCKSCKLYLEDIRIGKPTSRQPELCHHTYKSKIQQAEECDIIYLSAWLGQIGKNNLNLIRRICFKLSSDLYVARKGTSCLLKEFRQDDICQAGNESLFLEVALEALAKSESLVELRIQFDYVSTLMTHKDPTLPLPPISEYLTSTTFQLTMVTAAGYIHFLPGFDDALRDLRGINLLLEECLTTSLAPDPAPNSGQDFVFDNTSKARQQVLSSRSLIALPRSTESVAQGSRSHWTRPCIDQGNAWEDGGLGEMLLDIQLDEAAFAQLWNHSTNSKSR